MLFILLAIFYFFCRGKMISLFDIFIWIQLVSIAFSFFLLDNIEINTVTRFFNTLFLFLVLAIMIYPFRRYHNIKAITYHNLNRVKYLSKLLSIISAVTFVVLLITSYVIIVNISDINAFKYDGDESDILYRRLPISIKLFMFSSLFYNLAYFHFILHFYFHSRHEKYYSLINFILRFNFLPA